MAPRELGAVILGSNRSDDGEHIAVIADRRLSLSALSALLLTSPRFRFVGESRGRAETDALLNGARPKVAIVESNDDGRLPVVDVSNWDGRLLLLLDQEGDATSYSQAVAAAPHGYLSRGASLDLLIAAIDALLAGGFYIDPLVAAPIMAAMLMARKGSDRSELSSRERDILIRIATGYSTKQIAREYAIAPKTVANHVNNLYHKLHVRHRGELVLYAAERGLARI